LTDPCQLLYSVSVNKALDGQAVDQESERHLNSH
jgi:hypothetical protein